MSQRYERGSFLITSNRTVSEWGVVFGDAIAATAILDRMLRHSHVFTIRGDIYRLKDKRRTGAVLHQPRGLINQSSTRVGGQLLMSLGGQVLASLDIGIKRGTTGKHLDWVEAWRPDASPLPPLIPQASRHLPDFHRLASRAQHGVSQPQKDNFLPQKDVSQRLLDI